MTHSEAQVLKFAFILVVKIGRRQRSLASRWKQWCAKRKLLFANAQSWVRAFVSRSWDSAAQLCPAEGLVYHFNFISPVLHRYLTEEYALAGRQVEGQALLISQFPFHGAFPSLPYPIIVHKNKDIFSFGKIPIASPRLEWGGYCCVQQTSCSKERNCNHGLYSVRFLEERKLSRNSDNKTNAVAVLHILWSILMGTTIHIRHPIQ